MSAFGVAMRKIREGEDFVLDQHKGVRQTQFIFHMPLQPVGLLRIDKDRLTATHVSKKAPNGWVGVAFPIFFPQRVDRSGASS